MSQQTILDALQRFWLVLAGMAIVGTGIGVIYGLSSAREYTAEAQLSVGRVDVQTQSIPGFTQAALTLADSYSRAIAADKVLADISTESGIPVTEVIDRVTATPIPETGTVTVFATADSATGASALANTSADALVNYVRKLNRFNPDSERLLARYEAATRKLGAAKQEQQEQGESPETEAKVKSLELEVTTLGTLYSNSQAGQSSPNTLQVLALAADAEDDRSQTVQQAGLVGFVLGLLFGVVLALLLERRYPIMARR